jgi:hypothetical protein
MQRSHTVENQWFWSGWGIALHAFVESATERLVPCIHKYGDAVRILNLHHGERHRTNVASWTTILIPFSKTSTYSDYILSNDGIISEQ